MLGKLIRYDLKYGVRIFCVLHAVLFIAVFAGRFFYLDRIQFYDMSPQTIYTLLMFFSMFILLISIVSLGTTLLVAARFYKNLFTDEGYLTWTLPATPVQQLWAKILSGLIWTLASGLMLYAAMYLFASGDNVQAVLTEHAADITASLGMPLSRYCFTLVVTSVIGMPSSVILIYACVAIGQLFPAHRLLCAVITYCIFYGVLNGLTVALMFLLELVPGMRLPSPELSMNAFSISLFGVSVITSLIILALCYPATHYILTRKLNLN